ncbi:FAD/NAD(P)-binding domain-containing protein [Trichodelitschia bisporula]|uniref:FAD/NAD(P)-binding domain-containing protein n=1 Tax=Trichodelitschia bisporula TaxID=703511 RepID=A0A6G1HMA3_9PEZI|nr:FAD/NAD(P)-binding domain-containing protein [Trichodelitschia bisporula]
MAISDTPSDCKPIGSFAPSGIDVLVVGTGLAGLTAALECVRKGHRVRVLERNATINTAGDMYFMGLSATRFFTHWPEMEAEFRRISLSDAWMETYKHTGEAVIPAKKVADRLRAMGMEPPGSFQMRPLIYAMFVRQLEALSIHVEYNCRIVDYEETDGKGVAIAEDGRRFEADVVIAADGVGSKSQRLVGGQVRARTSGRAMWRAAFPAEYLNANPAVKEFFNMGGPNKDEPVVRIFLGPNTYGMTLTRPDTAIFVINHDAFGSEAESWNHTIDKEVVLVNMDKNIGPEPWAPIFKDFIRCCPPETVLDFELLWRNPQPSWASPGARVVQIGDSAHSFLPASGSGATQAIEDAVTLATCLQLGGKEGVADAVRAHVFLRFVRNACAQKLGFSNAELLQDTDWSKVKERPRTAQPKHPKWLFYHDPELYAYENFEKADKAVKSGARYLTDVPEILPNYPPGYKYEAWNIEQIMDDMKAGKQVELGAGDWE